MSKARSPRELCSTTIGTTGLTAGQSINARRRHRPGATADGGVRPRPRPRLGRCSARDPRSREPAVVAGTGKNMQQGSQASVTGWDFLTNHAHVLVCLLMTRESARATSPLRSGSPNGPPTGSCPSCSKRATCCASDMAGGTATRSSLSFPCAIPSSTSERSAICSKCCSGRRGQRGGLGTRARARPVAVHLKTLGLVWRIWMGCGRTERGGHCLRSLRCQAAARSVFRWRERVGAVLRVRRSDQSMRRARGRARRVPMTRG